MVYNLLGFTQILVRSCKVGTRLRDLLSGFAIGISYRRRYSLG